MMTYESLLKKAFGIFTSKKRRIFLFASFFVFCGTFLIMHYAHATVSEVAIAVVGGIASIVVWIVGQIIALVTFVLIAVANYNDFSTSTAITTGWVVLRDVANMFFIIIFLAIAFGTMLGEDIAPKYHYKKVLGRFIVMAILINFSKTIAGFIIDIGQVIMMTFVNGFSAAAGGNFLEVLQIRNLTSLTTYSGAEMGAPEVVGGLILAMVVAIISLICMTVLTMVLVVRMVTLWILVVVSPLAFFAAVTPMSRVQGYYSKWWDQLISNVMIGPVLAFFIWLSLAVVSNANFATEINGIAAGATAEETKISLATSGGGGGETTEGAGVPQAGPAAIGTPNIMLSYMIGIALLMGGLAMAQETGAAGAGYAGAASGWIRKQGSGAMKLAQRAAWAPVKGVGGAIGDSARAASLKMNSAMAQWGVPLVSSRAALQAGKIRGQMQKQESEMGGEIKNLTFDEVVGYRKSLRPITEKDKIKMNLLNKRLLETMKYEKWDANKQKLATSALKGVQGRARQTGNPDLFKFASDYKNNRLDFVEDTGEVGTLIGAMSELDVNKINDKAFDSTTEGGKRVMSALREKYSKDEEWASLRKAVGPTKRKLMDEYLKNRGEYVEKNPEKIEDPASRKEVVRKMGEGVVKLTKESLTEEVVGDMTSEQKMTMLKGNRLGAESFNADIFKESANLVAMHGSVELKDDLRKKFGKEYGNIMSQKRSEGQIAKDDSSTYNAPALATSKEMLRSGKGIKETFAVEKGNFETRTDKQAFYDAISEEKGGDPSLLLNLGIDDIQGEVEEIITESMYGDKELLRNMVTGAKTDQQQDIVERIVQNVYERAGTQADDNMIRFIEGNRRMRQFVPPEMKEQVKQKAANIKRERHEKGQEQAEEEAEKARVELAKKMAERAQERAKNEAEIQKGIDEAIALDIKAQEVAKQAVEEMLREEGEAIKEMEKNRSTVKTEPQQPTQSTERARIERQLDELSKQYRDIGDESAPLFNKMEKGEKLTDEEEKQNRDYDQQRESLVRESKKLQAQRAEIKEVIEERIEEIKKNIEGWKETRETLQLGSEKRKVDAQIAEREEEIQRLEEKLKKK